MQEIKLAQGECSNPPLHDDVSDDYSSIFSNSNIDDDDDNDMNSYHDSPIWIKCDPRGYWWPPTYSTWTPTIVSFSFPVSLIIAQFTIFGH